ncbi:MAG TPA: hypothetical protein VNX46_04230, partial [Candidatus Acidoferrum sp.]|nr:hypothetical protein [Candidatus Acidoferrum sp.]
MIVEQGVTVNGGLFGIGTLRTTGAMFSDSTITVNSEWDLFSNAALNGCTVYIQSGAVWYVEQAAGGNDVTITSSTISDDGGITLFDLSVINFNSGSNYLTLLPNAQLVGNGASSVINGSTLVFDNNGFVVGNPGTFQISFANTFWTDSQGVGTFSTFTSNSVIQILGNYELQAGTTNHFIGPGVTWFYGSIAAGSINGLFQIGDTNVGPGTVLSDGNFTGTGTIDVIGSPGMPSTFIWDNGILGSNLTMNIDPWSQLVLTNVNTKTMSGSLINNSGTTTWLTDNGNLQMDNGAVFNNGPGAMFLVENNADVIGGAGGILSFINNAGRFRKINSTNDTVFYQDNPPAPAPLFNNSGLLDVQSGGFFPRGGTNSGQFNIGSNGVIRFFGGTNTQLTGANFTGSGVPDVGIGADFWLANNLTFPNLEVDGTGVVDGPGNLSITGSLLANGGTYQGGGLIIIGPSASFTISNGATMNRSVNNSGAATNASLVSAPAPVTWNNLPGSWTVLDGGTFDFTYSGTPPVFNNAGTLLNIGSNLTSSMNWSVTNSGSIQVNPYSMLFSQNLTQGMGNTVVTSGALLNLVGNHQFAILGGSLSGSGKVQGTVVNSGTIHPGYSPGVLTINGTLTNNPTAILAVEIDGTNAGLQYSQLNDNVGQNYLGGALNVSFGGGFLPSLGQSFMVVNNAQINGTFNSLSGLHVPNGVVLVPEYSSSAVTLVAANSPNIAATSRSGNVTGFSVQTTAALTNIVEFTPTLSPPNWQNVGTIVGDGTLKPFLITNTSPTGFYRVRFE